ncbi:hypothetical protein P3G55_23100 [Leptospira sp. 96542]|nr:hypothetical protein [Leptospira sp. 96542]
MLDDLTQQDWIVIISALALGYGAVRYMLTSVQDRSTSLPNVKNHKRDAFFDDSHKENHLSTPYSWPAWHDVLGVSPNANLEEIKIAYTFKISQYRTETVSNLGPEFAALATQKMEEIRAAYEQAVQVRSNA